MLAAHGGVESLDVVYTDDRGEELCIRSEAEYREALQFSEQEGGTWRISLELSPNLSSGAARPAYAPSKPASVQQVGYESSALVEPAPLQVGVEELARCANNLGLDLIRTKPLLVKAPRRPLKHLSSPERSPQSKRRVL